MTRKPTARKTERKASTSELRPAIGYVRVSTQAQASEGHSLEAQKERIEAYCKSAGLQLLNVHTDAGVSGKRAANRPGLEASLNAVCRSGGVLVVAKLSRLARSTKDAIEICHRIESCGGDLASVGDNIDTSTPMGRFTFRLMASIDELERDNIAERTKEILGGLRSQGKRIGTVPYGYTLDDDGVQLTPEPAEQRGIERMRELLSLIHI